MPWTASYADSHCDVPEHAWHLAGVAIGITQYQSVGVYSYLVAPTETKDCSILA